MNNAAARNAPPGNAWPSFRQIRASAGSGKTYELTTSFLLLLAGAGDPPDQEGCRGGLKTGAWPEITAITFTNRAAAEMRERIIGRLKDMALVSPRGGGEGPAAHRASSGAIPEELAAAGWTPALARQRVTGILRRMSSLNVRTIDSLLHLVVRLSALDLDLPPDFDPVFAMDEALAPLMDAVLENARPGEDQDEDLTVLLEEACRHVFLHTRYTGFLAGSLLRNEVIEVLSALLSVPADRLASPEQAAARLGMRYGEACAAGRAMLACLEEEQLAPAANFVKALRALAGLGDNFAATGRWGELPSSKFLREKALLDDCLLKKGKGQASEQAEIAFARLRRAVRRMDTDGAILRQALSVLPYVRLATTLKEKLPDFLHEAAAIPAQLVPRLAVGILMRNHGVSDAICRLGSGLTHILVDEFQDTSREQWLALHPLVLEALSKGGSFTWVGDVKQAIYGWRGGDAALFDEALADASLLAVAQHAKRDSLLTNWRSCRAIVTTNNAIFSRLAEKETARAVLAAMLPSAVPAAVAESVLEEGCRLVQNGFASASQILLEDRPEGCVRLLELEGATGEEMEESVRLKLLSVLQDVGTRRAWGDVAVLVRSNARAGLAAAWLMDEGIPVVTENSFLLAEHPLIMQLVGLLRFLDCPEDDPAFLGLVSGSLFQPLLGLSDARITAWATGRNKVRREPLYLSFRRTFPRVWADWLEPFHSGAGLLTPYDATREALNRLAVSRRFPEHVAFVQRFLEVLHLAEGAGHSSFSTFLEQWRKSGGNEKAPMPENLDAVRVMTIHKAKGLQFPVVIVPWNDFTPHACTDMVEVQVDDLALLTRRSPALGEEYYRSLLADGREMLHLLYVAWTRPEEELYAFLPREGRSSFIPALDVLLAPLPRPNGVYALGASPSSPSPDTPPVPTASSAPLDMDSEGDLPHGMEANPFPPQTAAVWRPMQWLPRLRIFRAPLADLALHGKRRGLFVHHCLSCLRLPLQSSRSPAEAARQAVEWGLRSFPFPVHAPEVDIRTIVDRLAWYAGRPEAAHWLQYGTPEQSIVDESGEIHRADMVVDDGSRITVVEYKTGSPAPSHARQLLGYMRLAQQTQNAEEAAVPVEGALVYLDEKTISFLTLS